MVFFVFSSIMTDVFPLDVYVVDLRSGSLLASSIRTLVEYPSNYSEAVTGLVELLPSEEEMLAWEITDEQRTDRGVYQKCNLETEQHIDSYLEVFSNEKKALFSVSHFQETVSLELWDVPQCRVEKEILYPSAREIVFSPDGNSLAASNGYDAYVWDVGSSMVRFMVHGIPFKAPVDIMAFSADSNRLITSSFGRDTFGPTQPYRDYLISVWDAHTGIKLSEIAPHGEFLKQIASTPDKNIILAEDSAGFNFWNIETGQLLTTIPSGAFEFDVSEGGIWVSVKAPNDTETVTLFDYHSGDARRELDTRFSRVRDLYISEDGNKMAVMFLQEKGGDAVAVFDIKIDTRLWTVELADKRRYMDLGSQDSYYVTFDDGYKLWTFDPERSLMIFPGSLQEQSDRIIISQQDKTFQFWDAQSGVFLGEVYSSNKMEEFSLSPNGYHLATVGANGLIYIWGVRKH